MTADPKQFKVAKNLSQPGILFSMARVPNSQRLFYGNSDGKVYDIDLSAEKPEAKPMPGHSSYVTDMTLAGPYLVSGSYDRKLIWWNTETGEKIREIQAHDRWIRKLASTPDGKTVISVADDMLVKLWNAETGELIHELAGHAKQTPNNYPSMLYVATVSKDGVYVASGDKTGHVIVWEIATGKQVAAVDAPVMYTWDGKQRRHSIGGIRSLEFSPDGKLLAVGGIGKIGNIDHLGGQARVEIFDLQAGKRTHEFAGTKINGLVEQFAFHHDGDWLLATGGDHKGYTKFFDLKNNKLIREDAAPMHVHSAQLNETSDTVFAVGHGRIVTWELKAEPKAEEEKTT